MIKKVGIALSGGGARGFAHVGVLKALVAAGIRIDVVAGTSAGAIVGAAFACGMSPAEIEEMAFTIRYRNVMWPTLPVRGLFSNRPLENFVRRNYPKRTFAELSTPLGIVAFDVDTSAEVVITSGDIAKAVRASSAVPAVFSPVRDADGRLLVDGGVISPMPTATARALGADVVIGVDLAACGADFSGVNRLLPGIAMRGSLTLLQMASLGQHPETDIVIEPAIRQYRYDRISHRREMIALGEAAVLEKLDEIKKAIEQ